MADEPGIIICMLDTEPALTPSAPVRCFRCGTGLWISLSMQPEVEVGSMAPVCPMCGVAIMEGVDAELMIHPRQLPDLERHGIRQFAEDLMRRTKGGGP